MLNQHVTSTFLHIYAITITQQATSSTSHVIVNYVPEKINKLGLYTIHAKHLHAYSGMNAHNMLQMKSLTSSMQQGILYTHLTRQ